MYLALKHSSEMTLKTSKTLKNAHSSNDAKTPIIRTKLAATATLPRALSQSLTPFSVR